MTDKNHEVCNYYRSETNRRLQCIEDDMKTLLKFRVQILAITMVFTSVISVGMSFTIDYLIKKIG